LGDCTGDVAKKLFLFGVCSCKDIEIYNTLTSESFDSTKPGSKEKDNGSLATNANYKATSPVTLHGGIWAAGSVELVNKHELFNELRSGTGLSVPTGSTVHDDVFVQGNVSAPGGLTVDGALFVPPNSSVTGVTAAGGIKNQAVKIAKPCDCGTPIDVPKIVTSFANKNDNAKEKLAANALTKIVQPTTLSLPCGRYYLEEITPLGAEVTIKLDGRTALFVKGDVSPTGKLSIVMGPAAELDLFVAGNLSLGDVKRPYKSRMSVHGTGKFTSKTVFAGNLYLPNATLQVFNELEVWGSLFVGGLNVTSPMALHYDVAILGIDGCPDPEQKCDDCHDCINPKPACKGGSCAKCATDDDCCPPLICKADGTCELPQPK
jgi:hypothetical protein